MYLLKYIELYRVTTISLVLDRLWAQTSAYFKSLIQSCDRHWQLIHLFTAQTLFQCAQRLNWAQFANTWAHNLLGLGREIGVITEIRVIRFTALFGVTRVTGKVQSDEGMRVRRCTRDSIAYRRIDLYIAGVASIN